jgi:hypothetical protein
MTPWYAIGLAPLTQPWGRVAAGVSVIVEAKLSSWQDYLALALFCVIATSAILAMEIYAAFRPQLHQANDNRYVLSRLASLRRIGRAPGTGRAEAWR